MCVVNKMRLVIDLDGVICQLKNPDESYSDVKPNDDVLNLLREWKNSGHTIIIYSARHMRSCKGNVSEVINKIGKTTTEWLEKWKIPYDEIYFGKPYGDIYIDDLAITYTNTTDLKTKFELVTPIFVIPMAGEGKRFKEQGIDEPKFLLKTKGKTLFEWSLQSLPLDLAKKVIFVCLQEHQTKYKVDEFIKNILIKNYPTINYKILFLPQKTCGQVETVLSCKNEINESPLVIFNIDTIFFSSRLKSKLITTLFQQIDGILGAFHSNDQKFSYIEVDLEGIVKHTAEKKVISNIASTGLYTFTKGSDFVEAAENMIKNNKTTNNEFYVSELYNYLISKGKKFIIDFAEEFIPLGTPQEIKNFEMRK